jgi:hypothetical protein
MRSDLFDKEGMGKMLLPVEGQNTRPKVESGLSYKFQRLREKLRDAVVSGELAGKLPGERALARRFHVNAKTLSKALTDLAAEGLLDRSIGRGTFVKGSEPTPNSGRKCLVVCDPDQMGSAVVRHLSAAGAGCEIVTDVSALRPRFLNQFSGVIDLGTDTDDAFIRGLIVRNVSVVVVGKVPRKYSTHAVLFDVQLAVSQVGRMLLLDGHRHLAAIEPRSTTAVASALRAVAGRITPDAVIDGCFPADVPAMVANGVTGFVCHSVEWAGKVADQLERLHLQVPAQISLAAVGSCSGDGMVTGCYVDPAEKAAAIAQLMAEPPTTRPTTLWLAGKMVDRGTTGRVRTGPPVVMQNSARISI